MPKITVSIPTELTAKLEPIKEKINVSQVCREALEARIASFERVADQQDGEVDLDALIARLRAERTVVEGKFEELGRRNAATWLSTASYLEFKAVVDNHTPSNMDKYKLPRSAFRTMRRDMEKARAKLDGPQAVAYKRGWLDCARTVWAEVSDQVRQADETVDDMESVDGKNDSVQAATTK